MPDHLDRLQAERDTLHARMTDDPRARTIANYRRRDELDARIAARPGPRTCAAPGCPVEFTPTRADHIYHSAACKQRAHRAVDLAPRTCTAIGCAVTFTPSRATHVYHSAACRMRDMRARRGANTRTRITFDREAS